MNRIDNILADDSRERRHMMDVDITNADLAVFREVEATNRARYAVMSDAGESRVRVALVDIHGDHPRRTLHERLRQLLGDDGYWRSGVEFPRDINWRDIIHRNRMTSAVVHE